jgi:methylmalonyl-CoA/ethylmalonyl-CoA epimerase
MAAPRALKELGGLLRGLHHVAIATTSLAEARKTYGGQRVELVEPVGADSPVTKFLEKRGPGIHHLAWRVDDLVAAIARVKAAGLQMIHETPRPGSHGTKIAFIHPKSTGGVLMELVEDPNWSDR